MADQEIAGLVVKLEATTAQFRRQMADADKVVASATGKIDKELARVDSAFDRAGQSAQRASQMLKAAMGLVVAGGVGGLLKQAEAYTTISNRLKLVTSSSEELAQAQAAVFSIAQKGGQPLAATAELYQRIASNQKELKLTGEGVAGIVDTISKAMVISGTSAAGAQAALVQLGQAFASGTLRGEELNAVLEQAPALAQAIAAGMGKTVGELRALGSEGKLTADAVVSALQSQADAVDKQFRTMADTVGAAMTRVGNAVTQYIGQADAATGTSAALAGAITTIAEHVDTVASIMAGAGVAAAALYANKLAAAAVAAHTARSANIAQADSLLQAAIANQRAAQTATIRAAAEAQAARGTAVQTAMSIQLAQARTKEAAATHAVTVAQAGLRTASAGVLAALGGPVGLAVLAGTAATAFLMFRDNADEAKVSADSLAGSVRELSSAADLAAKRYASLLTSVDNFSKAQIAERYSELTRQLKYAEAQLKSFTRQYEKSGGSQGMVTGAQAAVDALKAEMARLDELRITGSGQVNKEYDKLLASLEKQAALQGVNSEAAKVRYAIEKGELGELGTAQEAALYRYAEEIDAKKALEESGKRSASATKDQAKALQNLLDSSALAIKSATAQADAYLAGEDNLRALNIQQEIEKELLKAGASARDKVTEAINRLRDAENRRDIGKTIADTRQQTKDIEAQIAAVLENAKSVSDGEAAQRAYNIEKQITAALAGKNASALKKETAELRKQLGIQEDLREELEAHKKIAGLIDSTATSQEKLNRQLEELNELMDYAKTPEQITAIQRAMKEAQDDASQWAQWTEEALGRVDGAFADAWKNIGDGFKSFSDGLKDAFKQMLAELAHMAITKPIIMQIGASLGIGGGTQGNNGIWGSLLGGGSGGGGLDFGKLLNYGQTAYSMFTGVGPAALAGYQSGGIMGGLQGAAGYYGNLASSAWGTVSGWLGGSAAAGAGSAAGTGFGYGQSLVSGQVGNAAYAGAQAGVGGNLSGLMGNLGAIAGPVAGLYMAIKGYGAISNGYDFKPKDFDDEFAGVRLGAKVINAYENGITKVFGDSSFLSKALRIPVATIGGLMSSVFGGGWETKNYGMAFSVANGDFLGQSYEDQKKKGGLFGSDKKRTKYRSLDPETAAVLQETYDATQAGVADLFASLSLTVEEGSLDGLKLAREKISTKGKTEEEIQQAIAEWFGSAADAMTAELNKVFNTGLDLDLEGMQAFVGNLTGVNEVLRYLDVEMYDASVAGGKLAEALSAAAGGLEALATNSQTYYDAFFSAEEKTADTIDAITRAFESADVELAASREAYRAMVEDIDLTTEAGQEMFATLMALSGQAAQYYSILEQQGAALIGAAGSAYAALQRSIANQQQEIQRAASSTASAINALTGVSNSLDAALKRLRGSSDDTVRMLRAQAVMTLNSALVTARAGGSLADYAGLQDALDVASNMDTSLYRSLEDFEREQGRTANLIAELEKVNGKQLSTEQRMLEKYEQQLSALDKQLAFAQSQLDALNGIDNSIMGVAAAIAAMNASVVAALQGLPKGAAQANTPQNNRSIVDSIYQSVLGRGTQGDEAGAEFWANALQNGTATYQDIATSIAKGALSNPAESASSKKSAEQYLKSLGIPGFASGGLFGGGLRIVGEKGPELEVTGPSRIYNASQTAAMLGGGGDAAREVRGLRSDFAGMMDALRSVAKHTMQTAKRVEFLERWDYDGLPEARAV